MLFFEKHNYKSVEFLGNFLYKFEVLNEKNSFHYDKIVSTVFIVGSHFNKTCRAICKWNQNGIKQSRGYLELNQMIKES